MEFTVINDPLAFCTAGLAGTALAGAGMMAMGVGGGEGLQRVVVEDSGEHATGTEKTHDNDDDDDEGALAHSPSPPLIEINLTEDDGNRRRIDQEGDEFSDDEVRVKGKAGLKFLRGLSDANVLCYLCIYT